MRIAAKPANASSSINALIDHWESVGVGAAAIALPTHKLAVAGETLLPPLVCKAPLGTVLR